MASKKVKISAHKVLGKMLQALLTPLGVKVLTEFPVMAEAPKGDILILRRQQPDWTPEQRALLPDGVRDSRASDILLEFKYTESVNKAALRQALGYDILYQRSQNLSEGEAQTFVLSAKTPRPETLQEFEYQPAEQPGVYRSSNIFIQEIPLLVLNELQAEPHNAFVKTLASRYGAKRAAFATLKAVGLYTFPGEIQWLITGLWRQWKMITEEMELEEVEISPEELIELGKQWQEIMLSQMPLEERLAGLEPEEVLPHFKLEERLAGLEPEERLAGLEPEEVLPHFKLEERLAGLEPEEILTNLPIEEIEAYLRKLKGGGQDS
jgi:hypothetical protein